MYCSPYVIFIFSFIDLTIVVINTYFLGSEKLVSIKNRLTPNQIYSLANRNTQLNSHHPLPSLIF